MFRQGERFELFLFDKKEVRRVSSLEGIQPRETLLVMERGGVIQKEMAVSGASTKETFESSLSELLPSHREMAYGTSSGLLYAVPEKKIKEILDSLKKMHIPVDEIVTEDQCLAWFYQNKISSAGPVLIIDKTPGRVLFLVLKNKNTVLSGAYVNENGENLFSEISFSLLHAGLKPERVILSGMNPEEREKAAGFFEATLDFEEKHELPLCSLGLKHWQSFPAASLLPKELKIQKWVQARRRRIKDFFTAASLFLASLVLFASAHSFSLDMKSKALEKKAETLRPQTVHLNKILSSLQKIRQAEVSKMRALQLFAGLAREVSPSIRLKELQAGENGILFRGESPSHTLVSDTARVFEGMETLKDAKMERTQVRKRLNQDYLEFEMTAKWKPAPKISEKPAAYSPEDKAAIEAEWKTKKDFFSGSQDSSEALNAWLAGFINYAQSSGLKIDKLEPAGTKTGENGKEMSVFLSFQSDMRKFNEFIYFLLEKDLLSGIQSVFIRQDENSKKLSFELMLEKALS